MSLENIADSFDKKKITFLNEVEQSVRSYVRGTGKQCIAVVEKIPKGDDYTILKHEIHFDDDLKTFVQVLIKFIRHSLYRGHQLDSALTDPVLKIIEEKYVELYESNGDMISEGFIEALRQNPLLLNSFVDRLTEKVVGKVSKKARAQVVHLIVHQIQDVTTSNTTQIVGQHVTHLAASTVGAQIAQIAAHVLLKVIAANIGHLIAKFLASAAFKKLITVLLHKMIVGIITAAVLKFLAAHIGGAIGAGTIMWIIFPIVAAILIKQITDFPKKLAREVSAAVRAHLATHFRDTNKDILTRTFEEIFNGEKLMQSVADDKIVKEMITKLSEKIVEGM